MVHSGAETNNWSINPPQSSPQMYLYEVAVKLNCTGGSGQVPDMVLCLEEVSASDLLVAADVVECSVSYFTIAYLNIDSSSLFKYGLKYM